MAESYHNSYLKRKRVDRKLRLIEMRGGGCERCGYNRCMEALEFHHSNPSDKCFGINGSTLASYKWERILEEFEKCIMLCANCHREINYGFVA